MYIYIHFNTIALHITHCGTSILLFIIKVNTNDNKTIITFLFLEFMFLDINRCVLNQLSEYYGDSKLKYINKHGHIF